MPAVSTVAEVLRRHGKLDPAEAARHRAHQRFERAALNNLSQMDFKGHFAMDRGRCHPLTVLDDHSRYSLGILARADETEATVKAHLSSLFRRFGLPGAMLADNGSPWGRSGASGYTAFEVWLLRVGIPLHHGRPYHPQTQGKDERFHRTLKVEVVQLRRLADLAACQQAFDTFRTVYNEDRPHEALAMAVPASRDTPSHIPFPQRLADPEYYETDAVRRVHGDGAISFQARRVKLPQAFAGLDVALHPTATEGVWRVFFRAPPDRGGRPPRSGSAWCNCQEGLRTPVRNLSGLNT